MNYAKVIEKILDEMYRDNLASGGNTVGEVEILKQKCEELFKKDGCNLHKWLSNITSLENTKITTKIILKSQLLTMISFNLMNKKEVSSTVPLTQKVVLVHLNITK